MSRGPRSSTRCGAVAVRVIPAAFLHACAVLVDYPPPPTTFSQHGTAPHRVARGRVYVWLRRH